MTTTLLVLTVLAAVTVLATGDEYAIDTGSGQSQLEGHESYNAYLREKAEIDKRELRDIGSCTHFSIDTDPSRDPDMVGARHLWGEMQLFIGQCGETHGYSDEWCKSVVRFMKNSVDFRELELAVSGIHTNHDDHSHARSLSEVPDEVYAHTKESYDRVVRQYVNRNKKSIK
jgi:hypothetical protein